MMYTPDDFVVEDASRLHSFIDDYGFAALVSAADGIPLATHLPFLLEVDADDRPLLCAHMARANPQWRDLEKAKSVLVMFQGPHAYVSPNWYATTGRAPTWNYTAVHAYGHARLVDDPARKRSIMERLVSRHEGTSSASWHLDRLDEDSIREKLSNVVAFEIPIERIEGTFKLSQNLAAADQKGVVVALDMSGDPMDATVARLMKEGKHR